MVSNQLEERVKAFRKQLREINKAFNDACQQGTEDAALFEYKRLEDFIANVEALITGNKDYFSVSAGGEFQHPDDAIAASTGSATSQAKQALEEAEELRAALEKHYNDTFA